jgi:hypothetical protein
MSSVKEPAYFSRHHVRDDVRRMVPHLQSENAYLKLFSDATDAHLIVGESSTCYMRAESDLLELKNFSGEPKIIALIRDPVSLISSYFHYLRFQKWEPLGTLQEAWEIQDERCMGRIISPTANRPDSLAYRNVALLGQQVERLFRIFGRDNVLVIVADDLRCDTENVCRSLQEFLGLTYVDGIAMPHTNVARAAKVRIIDDLMKRDSKNLLRLKNQVKKLFSVQSFGIRRLVESANSSPIKHSVRTDLRDEMREYFWDDVELLSKTIEQNLLKRWGWEKTTLSRDNGEAQTSVSRS